MPTPENRPAGLVSAVAIVACIIAPAPAPAQSGQDAAKVAKAQPNFYAGPVKVPVQSRMGNKPIGAAAAQTDSRTVAAAIDPRAPKYTSAHQLGFEKPRITIPRVQSAGQSTQPNTRTATAGQRETHYPGQTFYQNSTGASARMQPRTPTRQQAATVQAVSHQRGGFGRLFQSHSQQTRAAVVEAPRYQTTGLLQQGQASWYGKDFHGGKTANGETYDMNSMTAAHRTLPFGTMVKVTNIHNGAETVVRVNNRGPFHGNRIIDLSKGAAAQLGMVNRGVAQVKLEIVKLATGR